MKINEKICIWAITPGGCSLGLELGDKLDNADCYVPAWLENSLDIQSSEDNQSSENNHSSDDNQSGQNNHSSDDNQSSRDNQNSRDNKCSRDKSIPGHTNQGKLISSHNSQGKLISGNKGNIFFFKSLAEKIKEKFTGYSGHVFIFSTGIAVRLIAPLLRSKLKDPAVVVLDEKACHAISLVSGHIGNANNLAEKIAELTGADPVITTATDVNHLPAIDMIAKKKNLIIENPRMIKTINMAFLKNQKINLMDPHGLVSPHLPDNLIYQDMETISYKKAGINTASRRSCFAPGFCCDRTSKTGHTGYKVLEEKNGKTVKKNNKIKEEAEEEDQTHGFPSVLCSDEIIPVSRETLILRPLLLTVGIGCNRNTSSDEIASFLKLIFNDLLLSMKSIELLASSDIKQDEQGLLELADKMNLTINFYDKKQLNSVTNIQNPSAMVEKHIGVKSVCEAAAILASGSGELIVPKMKKGNVTLAVARKPQNYL